jgi:ABC-type proline/glycine betaine transport system permease subunit
MYGGTGVFLLESLDIPARRDQAIYAGFSVVAGIGVIAAAIFLERVCKLPDDDEHEGTGAAPTT